MLKRGAQGPEVKNLQAALVELGYALPRWGVDGELGAETMDVLADFLREHGAAVDDDADVVTDAELALLQKMVESTRHAPRGPSLQNGRFHDLRQQAAQNRLGGRRSWAQITGVTLHQTACVLGEKPLRWSPVAAHLGVTRAGQVIWLHDFEKIVWHGNGFNTATVGIEMDGTYAGVEGDDRTFWRPASDPGLKAQSPTTELVEAAKASVRWICQQIALRGGRVEHLYAHRQASSERRSDPGSALWQSVGLELIKELKLSDGGPGFCIGKGRAIPEEWDPSRAGQRY